MQNAIRSMVVLAMAVTSSPVFADGNDTGNAQQPEAQGGMSSEVRADEPGSASGEPGRMDADTRTDQQKIDDWNHQEFVRHVWEDE